MIFFPKLYSSGFAIAHRCPLAATALPTCNLGRLSSSPSQSNCCTKKSHIASKRKGIERMKVRRAIGSIMNLCLILMDLRENLILGLGFGF